MVQTLEAVEISDKHQRLAVLAEDTRTRMKRSALDIYHIGANLLEAQDLLAHGEFLPWIEAEFGMGKSSAYKFIGVAKAFQGKFPQNGNLEIAASALYLLASSNTPESARTEAVELAATGEVITTYKAKEIREKHRPGALPPSVNTSNSSRNSSDASQSNSTQATVWPAAQVDEFRLGVICRVVDRKQENLFGRKVEILEMCGSDFAIFKALDNGEKSCLFTKHLKPLQCSPNYYLSQTLERVGLPHSLAITLLRQIVEQVELPRDLLDEVLKFG